MGLHKKINHGADFFWFQSHFFCFISMRRFRWNPYSQGACRWKAMENNYMLIETEFTEGRRVFFQCRGSLVERQGGGWPGWVSWDAICSLACLKGSKKRELTELCVGTLCRTRWSLQFCFWVCVTQWSLEWRLGHSFLSSCSNSNSRELLPQPGVFQKTISLGARLAA